MAQTILLKRRTSDATAPSASDLTTGEVAVNAYSGKLYIKKTDGTVTEVSGSGGGSSSFPAVYNTYKYTATNGQTTFVGNDSSSNFLTYNVGNLIVFLNGVLLVPTTDYVATTGNTVVLQDGATTNDILTIVAFTATIGDGNVAVDTFSGDGSTTAFTLAANPQNENNTQVFIDGIYQSKSNYSVSGTTLTFSTAPPNNTSIEVTTGSREVTQYTATTLELPNAGMSITGGDLDIPSDSRKIKLGASNDLQIFHDGTNNYIQGGTGDLRIDAKSGERGIVVTPDGATTLYHDNAAKIATASGGVTITGTATATTFVGALTGNASTATALATARTIGGTSFDGTANIAVNLAATATALATARTIGGTSFDGTANIVPANAVSVTGAAQSAITSVGTLSALTISGDLTVDTSTLKVDSSNNRVGIGTATPGNIVEVVGASPIVEINASSGSPELQFSDGGTDEYSIMYDTGSNSFKFIEGGVGTKFSIADGGAATFYNSLTANGAIASFVDTYKNLRTLALTTDNFSNEGVGISFSRTSSDSALMAVGVLDTDKLSLLSRSGIIFATGGSSLYSQTSEAMRIDTSGHVGIGTTSPDANNFGAGHGVLTVASDTGSAKTAMLNIMGDGNDTDATRVSSLFFNDQSATGAGATLAGVEAYRASNHATDPGADLLFSTNKSGGSYTEKMRIQADGTTTIGRPITTTYVNSQGYPLHIQASGANQTYLAISVPGDNSGDTGVVIGHDATGTRIVNRENQPILFHTGSSSGLTFTMEADGDFSIADGNLVVANGHGIDFTNTANSHSGSSHSTLDDYEEGSWTPTLYGGTTAVSVTSAVGRYTKIGNLVTVWGSLTRSDSSSVSSHLNIRGLPFTNENVTYLVRMGMGHIWIDNGVNLDRTGLTYITTTDIIYGVMDYGVRGGRYLQITSLTNGRPIYFCSSYQTAE